MSRLLRAAVILLLLASCGGGYAPPRNLDDACSILSERPSYWRAMKRAESRWGIPIHVQMAVIHQESKFVGNAKTPQRFALGVIPMGRQSSAMGYAQALDATWEEYQSETRNFWAKRTNFDDAVDFMGWYMDRASQKLGISKNDARAQYLAYHEGYSGYASGSYRRKDWLLAVAARVADRAETYRLQLYVCRRN